MPNRKKADLIIHPTRLQILLALTAQPRTTREIAQVLPGIATPSIYRHLRELLEGGIVEVAETRRVRGVDEKIYRLAQAPHLTQEDIAGMSRDEHLHYFNAFAAMLMQGFASYLDMTYQEAAAAGSSEPDFLGDRAGFTEITFYASVEELDAFRITLNQSLAHLASLPPAPERKYRKLAFISHPLGVLPH
jgi:DNA-binding transcriptional ArsR family regulator